MNKITTQTTVPRVALDMYVLTQGVKTGIYRVCSELYPLLAKAPGIEVSLFHRQSSSASPVLQDVAVAAYASLDDSHAADVLLSPFGVAPEDWLRDPEILHAHIVYDLIGIKHPEYFTPQAAKEVQRIVDSLDERTVIFAISQFTKNDLLKLRPDLDPAQITVIPLAAGGKFLPCSDLDSRAAVRIKYGIPSAVPYMLSVATLEIRKNLESVIQAFLVYQERTPDNDLHLVLAGMSGWKLDQLNVALESAAKWRHRIVLTGFVDDEDLSPLYSDALCFVYLSRHEGFGLPPLEAMACGTPVICSDNSSLPEVVGSAGILLDALDVNGVADAVQKISDSADARAALATAGLLRSRDFTWQRCADQVAETLRDAINVHRARPRPRAVREYLPNELARQYPGPDGSPQANATFYLNGSCGPDFQSVETPDAAWESAAWPTWRDSLPGKSGQRIEGGLRTRGILKSGAVHEPLVSYVTVVRNNEATLARTIESVQAQTYPNVEHIVLDGASTDATLEVIQRYAHCLDYFASEKDGGLYQAVNKAIPLARGQIICILNSDDWLVPRAAEIAVRRLAELEMPGLLLTGALAKGADVSVEWNPVFVHPGCYFMCANDCHNAIYATRSAYQASGPYDESYRIAADFKWIMTCLDAGINFYYSREITVNYSMGGTSGDVGKHSLECMRVVAQRFPFLSEDEVYGLYSCFFLFRDAAGLEDRVQNKTQFVRHLLNRHAENIDFTRALTWAAILKLEHLNNAVEQSALTANVAPNGSEVKALIKRVLHRHPAAYRFAQRVYARSTAR